jgi:hypothetical protein
MKTVDVKKTDEVFAETVLPLTLRIILERHGEESCQEEVVRQCHFFVWITGETGIDLFVVDAGRLRRFLSYNGVLSVEEINAADK